MRVKLYESKWLHSINNDLANRFRTTLMNDDVDGAIPVSIEVLEECKSFFSPDGDEDYKLDEIDNLIDDFNEVEHEYDAVDNLLDVLYDFCDENNIWIPVVDDTENTDEPEAEPEFEKTPKPGELEGDAEFVEVSDDDKE